MKYLIDGETISGIAQEIRTKTHKTDLLTATEMKAEISTFPNIKIWDVTIETPFGGGYDDGSVTEYSVLNDDEFIKKYYNNDNLKMFLIPKSAVGENAVCFMFGGNVPYYVRPSGTEYRTVNALNTNGSSAQIYADAARLYARTSGVGFYLLNTGEIRIRCLGARTFAAGEYTIFAIVL